MSTGELVITTESPSETKEVGKKIGALLFPGAVIALKGELGSGKTCLTQGIAQGLGVSNKVTSPSYTLINEYQGRYPLVHIDLYRLQQSTEIEGLGYEDYFYADGVVVVEWAERVSTGFPVAYLEIVLYYLGKNTRKIQLISPQGRYNEFINQLKATLVI